MRTKINICDGGGNTKIVIAAKYCEGECQRYANRYCDKCKVEVCPAATICPICGEKTEEIENYENNITNYIT